MPAGASPKREREFENLEQRFKKEGRYQGRETEVAARIVNKQRAAYGETREEREQARAGRAPDRGLPVDGYERMTIPRIRAVLPTLGKAALRKIEDHERRHKNRKGVIAAIERQQRSPGK